MKSLFVSAVFTTFLVAWFPLSQGFHPSRLLPTLHPSRLLPTLPACFVRFGRCGTDRSARTISLQTHGAEGKRDIMPLKANRKKAGGVAGSGKLTSAPTVAVAALQAAKSPKKGVQPAQKSGNQPAQKSVNQVKNIQLPQESGNQVKKSKQRAGAAEGAARKALKDVQRFLHKVLAYGIDYSVCATYGAGNLEGPNHVAVGSDGKVLVTDAKLQQVIVLKSDGSVVQTFGTLGGSDQIGDFRCPLGIAVDRRGRIVVADSGNHRIQILDAEGKVVLFFGRQGSAPGEFNNPVGVAIDCEGNILVADKGNSRIQVFNEEGVFVQSFGPPLGQTLTPTAVAVDLKANRIVVVNGEYHGRALYVFNSNGTVALSFGYIYPDHVRSVGPAHFSYPEGVAVDMEGRIYVADSLNNRIQVFFRDGNYSHMIDKAALGLEQLEYPFSVAVDESDGILVSTGYRINYVGKMCNPPEHWDKPAYRFGQFADLWRKPADHEVKPRHKPLVLQIVRYEMQAPSAAQTVIECALSLPQKVPESRMQRRVAKVYGAGILERPSHLRFIRMRKLQ